MCEYGTAYDHFGFAVKLVAVRSCIVARSVILLPSVHPRYSPRVCIDPARPRMSPTSDPPSTAAPSRPIQGALAVVLMLALALAAATFATVWAHSRWYDDWRVYEAATFWGGIATSLAFAAVSVLAWRRTALVLATISAMLAFDALLWVLGVTSVMQIFFFAFLFGPPLATALVLGIVLWSRRRHATDPPRPAGRLLLGLAIGAILQIPIASVPRMLYAHDLFAAKHHCETVIVALADYRERHGQYPDDLGFLAGEPRPRLLRRGFYRRDQSEFVLSVPTGYWGHLEYHSAAHEWRFDD
jgi:hypothetical protein